MLKFVNKHALEKKLKSLPEAIRKRAQADLMASAREINMLQRSLVPVDDGDLRSSIRNEPLALPQVGAVLKAGGPLTTRKIGSRTYDREIAIGTRSTTRGAKKQKSGKSVVYDYAFAQEFGTSDMPANAFFRPGFLARKAKAQSQMRAGVRRTLRQLKKAGT